MRKLRKVDIMKKKRNLILIGHFENKFNPMFNCANDGKQVVLNKLMDEIAEMLLYLVWLFSYMIHVEIQT